uniref:WGS project CAEQ00000000 data, annotated contig 1426 n=1 Tax=Trypanosoma congolense (strain IL3000) TaxID=1068625 RepID=F9W661_TRYCI|nr:unnamed protein product [Trypanosoma congolense IL3000]
MRRSEGTKVARRLGKSFGKKAAAKKEDVCSDIKKLEEQKKELIQTVIRLRNDLDMAKQQQSPKWKAVIRSCPSEHVTLIEPVHTLMIDDKDFDPSTKLTLRCPVQELRARHYAGYLDLGKLVDRKLSLLELGRGCVANKSLISRLSSLETLILDGTNACGGWLDGVASADGLREVVLRNMPTLRYAPFLQNMQCLDSLTIHDCSELLTIGDKPFWPQLTRLDIANTSLLLDSLIQRLEQCTCLTVLRLHGCLSVGCRVLVSGCTLLRELCLDGVRGSPLFVQGAELPFLRVVQLRNSGVTDEDVKVLSTFQSLEEVDLSGCSHITDVSPLTHLVALRTLILNRCTGARVVGPTVAMPMLEKLLLHGTDVRDKCVLELCTGPIAELDLRHCRPLSEDTIRALLALPSLRALYVNDLPDATLQDGTKLEALGLCSRAISDAVMGAIFHGCTALTRLDLRQRAGTADLSGLTALGNLTALCLCGPKHVVGINSIVKLQHLAELTLEGHFVDNNVAITIAGCKALRSLKLANAAALGYMGPFLGMGLLRELCFTDCGPMVVDVPHRKTGEDMDISLRATPLSRENMKKVARMKFVRHLRLERCGKVHLSDIKVATCTVVECERLVGEPEKVPMNVQVVRTPLIKSDN